MRKYSHDTILRLRLKHRPGQLARLAAAIADQGALVGEIGTVQIGEVDTIRDVTVETNDEDHTARVVAAVRALADVDLLETFDRVFEAHRGGKLRTTSRLALEHVSELRYIYTPASPASRGPSSETPTSPGISPASAPPSASSPTGPASSGSATSAPSPASR
jgi:hypothetical protein